MSRIGIIGGSGLYKLEGVQIEAEKAIETPFGKPSALISIGTFGSVPVAFLPRHGRHHEFLPHEINYRANLWALKDVGCTSVLSFSATGSLREEIAPGDLSVVGQYLDWTRGKRASTYFGEGVAAHISTAEPTCAHLASRLKRAAESAKVPLHADKTYACVEGPRLGTRAESFFLRGAGCDLVGMTNVPEAFLAREAQLCYTTIAIATDYDCWKDDPNEHVSVEMVIQRYGQSLGKIQKILAEFMGRYSSEKDLAPCSCRQALKGAIMTPKESLSPKNLEMISFLET